MMNSNTALFLLILFLSLATGVVRAESAWVSDQFEITLRSGPSTSNAIQRMLSSGTEVEVLERDSETGYSRVRTAGGTEGWVLTRYLMNEPAAREQLATLTNRLTDAASRGTSLNSQLQAIREEQEAAQRRIQTLEREKASVEEELAEIKRTASNVLSIDNQNKQLREQVEAANIRITALEQENRELSGQTTRYWFLAGALVLIVGMVLGLWLPRIRWQRRSRYERF